MNLEKLTQTAEQSRRTFLRTALVAAIGTVACSANSSSYASEPQTEPSKEELEEWVNSLPKPKYTYEEFTRALGKSYDSLPEKAKKETEKYWHWARPESGNVLVSGDKITEIYSNPQEYHKNLPKKERKMFNDFIQSYKKIKESGKKDLILESIKLDCKKNYPWKINIENPTLAEQLVLFSIVRNWNRIDKSRNKH